MLVRRFVHSRRIFGTRETTWDKRDSALYPLVSKCERVDNVR